MIDIVREIEAVQREVGERRDRRRRRAMRSAFAATTTRPSTTSGTP